MNQVRQHLRNFYPNINVLKKTPVVSFNANENMFIRNASELESKIVKMKASQFGSHSVDIVSDFDQTISAFHDDNKQTVAASFGIFQQSKDGPKNLSDLANSVFQKYYKYEVSKEYPLDFKKQMMNEWLRESMAIITDNEIHCEWLQQIMNCNTFAFRHNFDQFLKYSAEQEVNFIIVSGGIQDVIFYLMNQLHPLREYPRLELIANKVYFAPDGKVIGSHDEFVHSHNKESLVLRETFPQLRSNCILLGDMVHDSFMTKQTKYENEIKIGFLKNRDNLENYLKKFDIVLHDQGSFVAVEYLLRKLITPAQPIPQLLSEKAHVVAKPLVEILDKLAEPISEEAQVNPSELSHAARLIKF